MFSLSLISNCCCFYYCLTMASKYLEFMLECYVFVIYICTKMTKPHEEKLITKAKYINQHLRNKKENVSIQKLIKKFKLMFSIQ